MNRRKLAAGIVAVPICVAIIMFLFRKTLFALGAALLLSPSGGFDETKAPPQPDYSDPAAWAALQVARRQQNRVAVGCGIDSGLDRQTVGTAVGSKVPRPR